MCYFLSMPIQVLLCVQLCGLSLYMVYTGNRMEFHLQTVAKVGKYDIYRWWAAMFIYDHEKDCK